MRQPRIHLSRSTGESRQSLIPNISFIIFIILFIDHIIQMEQTNLKNQIFANFKDIGLQDELKKHLRIQICEKLKAKDLIRKQSNQQTKLYNRIMASLISEELKLIDCGYSNSIFVVQSGFDDKVLSRQEILQLISLNEEDLESGISILSNMIKRKYPFNGGTVKNMSVQTKPEEVGYTLEQRLTLIDQEYRKNMGRSKEKDDYSLNQAKIKEYEEEIKRNYEKDLQRFKEFQIHRIKVQASQEWRKRYQEYSKSVEDDYRRKIQVFHKKQKLFQDEMVGRQKNLDQKAHTLQKSLKEKLQLLDMKSLTVEDHLRNIEGEKKRMKGEIEKEQKEIRNKVREYDELLLNVNKKIQYEVNVKRLAIQQEYQNKESQFLNRKKFIDEEYGKLMGIKDTTELIKQQNGRLFDENKRLRNDLTTIQQQLRVAISENGSKTDRIQKLKQQVEELEMEKKRTEDRWREDDKKKKNKEKEIIKLREELEELRRLNEQYENDDSVSLDLNERRENKNELDLKLQNLKNERKKEIEKLKMGL